MSLFTDLIAQIPAVTDGVPLGMDEEYPGCRFVIQAAVVPPGSTLPFTLGTSFLGGPRWMDITPDCQGISWQRGGAPGQRPIAGEMTLRLDNRQHKYHPWQSLYYGPGTLLRAVISDGMRICSYQFTGLVQKWVEDGEGLEAYAWVDINVWEVQFLLNEVNDNALISPIGAGDDLLARFNRLLAQAAWAFGLNVFTTQHATFQATNLSQDVATEAYLTVDSVDATLWSGKDGTLYVRDRSRGSGILWEIDWPDMHPDAAKNANDDERILSEVNLARTGGTEVNYSNPTLAGRYQKRSTKRDGLITQAEAADADLARVAAGILGRADQTYRPVSLGLDSGQNHIARRLLVEAELTDRLTIDRLVGGEHRVVFSRYAICAISVGVMVSAAGTHWSGDIGLDIETDSDWTVVSSPLIWGVHTWGSGHTWGPRDYDMFPRAKWGTAKWGRDKWSL